MEPATSWDLIRAASAGEADARADFVRLYALPLRAFFHGRWRATPVASEIDDAVQDVLLDCLREGGALSRVEADRPGGFLAYLRGVARCVALRVEERAHRRSRAGGEALEHVHDPVCEERASVAFDRAWAQSVLRAAARILSERASEADAAARRRVELLELRFGEDLPIRAIAQRWGETPERVHREYARAREEFRRALHAVLAAQHGGPPPVLEREVERLLECLG